MLDFLKPKHRRKRRRQQDPAKQLGNAAGKLISAVLITAVTSFFRKK